jgi:DNA mismatch repair protein MutL
MTGNRIRILPDLLAIKIAAGEVVERPVSVVKELIENSLDAGSTKIWVLLRQGGRKSMEVVDEGEGMGREDALLALERHSTSKIHTEEDLTRIATMGFRGEALPSIASVSKMVLTTKRAEELAGWEIRVEAGKVTQVRECGCPNGTTVQVEELFFNLPARQEFLRSPGTEMGHVSELVTRVALAYPSIHFKLFHEGRCLLDCPPTSSEDRILHLLPKEVRPQRVSVIANEGGMELRGVVFSGKVTFPSLKHIHTYVNGRAVRDRILIHAVMEAYQTLLMRGRYPAAVLFLKVPLDEVDVNVHPAKLEVRFRRSQAVHEFVARAVRLQLKNGPRFAAWEPGKTETGQGTVWEPGSPYGALSKEKDNPKLDFLVPALQRRVEGEKEFALEIAKGRSFSSLSFVGQLHGTYLILQSDHGMVLLDQHAAHERIAFERLREQIRLDGVLSQRLLIPQVIDVGETETPILRERAEQLSRFGFEIDQIGEKSFAIRAVPVLLQTQDYGAVVLEVIAELREWGHGGKLVEKVDEVLSTIACHSVIGAHRFLDRSEVRALLADLDRIDFSQQCPHGRPVSTEISQGEIERMFRRR